MMAVEFGVLSHMISASTGACFAHEEAVALAVCHHIISNAGCG